MAELSAEAAKPRRPRVGGPWTTQLAALLAGTAAALAHPPWSFYPGLLGYAAILLLVDRTGPQRPLKGAFLRGWLAGCGYFLISLHWLVDPFFVDAKDQGWMAPIAVAAVDMGMALFWGAAACLYRACAATGPARVLLFAAALAACEWLRGHVLTGFPWDLPGETWPAGSALSQTAAAVGAYGLTWITLALASAPALLVEGRKGGLATAAAVAAAGALWAFGALRLSEQPPFSPGPSVRIVQADVKQETKYDIGVFRSILGRYTALTAQPSARRADIVVWPEGAVPAAFEDYLAPGTWTEEAVQNALLPGQILIVGGYRWAKAERGADVAYNSLAVLQRTAMGLNLLGLYDKYRLVPFGEFMPLDALASKLGVKQFVHVGDGFVPGPPPAPLRVAGVPVFQPLICYESLFPGFTRDGAARSHLRPSLIVNISNDAWFGSGSGPRQHLNIASYRAIEEGLPMVRATPTGLSAVVDAFGRIAPGAVLTQGAYGVIDARIPPALAPTLFDRWGDGAFLLMLLASLVGVDPTRIVKSVRRP